MAPLARGSTSEDESPVAPPRSGFPPPAIPPLPPPSRCVVLLLARASWRAAETPGGSFRYAYGATPVPTWDSQPVGGAQGLNARQLLDPGDSRLGNPPPRIQKIERVRITEIRKAPRPNSFFNAFLIWLRSVDCGLKEDSTASTASLIFLNPFPPPYPNCSGKLYTVLPYPSASDVSSHSV